jgi:hypothetical protein
MRTASAHLEPDAECVYNDVAHRKVPTGAGAFGTRRDEARFRLALATIQPEMRARSEIFADVEPVPRAVKFLSIFRCSIRAPAGSDTPQYR